MSEEFPFVGRREEISLIESAIVDKKNQQIILIDADGGVGKTRLLQEVYLRFLQLKMRLLTTNPSFSLTITNLVDLSNLSVSLPLTIEHLIGNYLGENHFASFNSIRHDYYKAQSVGASTETTNRQFQLACQTFIEDFNNFSIKNRCIVLIDTIDQHIINDQSFLNFVSTILPQLKNVVFVVAGRQAKALELILQGQEYFHVLLLELKGLVVEESSLFFNGLDLEPDLEAKLATLTSGQPILLSLAAIWLEQEVPLPIIDATTSLQLQNLAPDELSHIRQQFREALISRILRHEEVLYILEMAHLEKRYSAEIMSYLHNVSDEVAESKLDEMSSFFFVKNRPDAIHVLHDEMRDLVNSIAWPQFDPLGLERKALSEKIDGYYNTKLNNLNSQIITLKNKVEHYNEKAHALSLLVDSQKLFQLQRHFWVLTSERLFYKLELSPDGVAMFIGDELERSIKELSRDYPRLLVNLVTPYLSKLGDEAYFHVQYQISRWLRVIGELDNATSILRDLLSKFDNSDENHISILQTLAATLGDKGLSQEALSHLNTALEICKAKVMDLSEAYVRNSLGMVLVALGKINEAVIEYERCIEICDKLGLDNLRPTVMNSVGYAYSILGDHERAASYCENALELRQSLGSMRDIAGSHATLGSIYRDMGDFDFARNHYQYSFEFFLAHDDKFWIARIRMEQGILNMFEFEEKYYRTIERSAASAENLKYLVYAAEKYIKEAAELGKVYNQKELAKTLHELGHVYWEKGDLDQAEKTWHESLAYSEIANNFRYIVENLVGFCELDFDRGKYKAVLNHRQNLLPYYDETVDSHGLLWSRLARMEGFASYHLGDRKTALEKFSYAYPVLAQHGGWGRYKLAIELQQLADLIDSSPSADAKAWCGSFLDLWFKDENELTPKNERVLKMFLSTRLLKANRRE